MRCPIVCVAIVAGCSALAWADSTGAGTLDLSWHTIDGGGGTSTGGTFSISGTIGQCDAGMALTGGSFGLVGGFWAAPAVLSAPPCPADFDGSHVVNGIDLAILLGQWSGAAVYAPCPPFKLQDLNHDCRVNGLDLAILLAAWGACL